MSRWGQHSCPFFPSLFPVVSDGRKSFGDGMSVRWERQGGILTGTLTNLGCIQSGTTKLCISKAWIPRVRRVN